MRKPWPTFSTESAGFCLSPPSDSDRLLPVVPTAVRRSLLIMDAKQGFQIEYKRGSMECYFVRYSNWYSNQNTKPILTIIINRINYRFKLPRPTNSTSKDVHGRLFLCLEFSKSLETDDSRLSTSPPYTCTLGITWIADWVPRVSSRYS